MGASVFDELVQEKLYPIFGDLTEENMGLPEEDITILCSQINVIFHCAGNVDGNERMENSIKVKIYLTPSPFFLIN